MTDNKNEQTFNQLKISKAPNSKPDSTQLYLANFHNTEQLDALLEKYRFASMHDLMLSCYNEAVHYVMSSLGLTSSDKLLSPSKFIQFTQAGYTSDVAIHDLSNGRLIIVNDGLNLILDNQDNLISSNYVENLNPLFFTPAKNKISDLIEKHLSLPISNLDGKLENYNAFNRMPMISTDKSIDFSDEKIAAVFSGERFDIYKQRNPDICFTDYSNAKAYDKILRILLGKDKGNILSMIEYVKETINNEKSVLEPNIPITWNPRYNFLFIPEKDGGERSIIRPLFRMSDKYDYSIFMDGGFRNCESTSGYRGTSFWMKPKTEDKLAKV